MTDEFITKGLEDDRYLKARRLIGQFEREIETVLYEADRRMVEQQRELFDPRTDPDVKTRRNSGSTLGYHRSNHPFDGSLADEVNERLNIHLYWMDPVDYNRRNVGGALRAFGYKIKGADVDIDGQVAQETESSEWSLRTAENPFDDNFAYYRHVSSYDDIDETTDEMCRHFGEFGHRYRP